MSVTSIREDKRAHSRWNGWYCLVCLSHCMKGGRKGKQGGWSNVPHKGRWVSHANSLPFPEHQRSHCYQLLFWPQQKTPDPRVEGYFHGRTKAVCPDTEEPRAHTLPTPAGGAGSWSHVALAMPRQWPLLVPTTLGSSRVYCGLCHVMAHLLSPSGSISLSHLSSIRPSHRNDWVFFFLLWVF